MGPRSTLMRLPHSLSTAGSACGNAQAEGFNKPLMKVIRSAVVEQRNWKQEMYQLLRQYRATPHTSTKFSPHRLLFGREPGTKLPWVSTEDNHDNRAVHAVARENDKQAKQCQKTYADKRNKAEHNNLHVGDMVLMRNDKRSNKLSSAFSHKPMFVTDMYAVPPSQQLTTITRSGEILLVSRRYSIHCRALKKWVVEKSISLLGQSCRRHRLQSFIHRIRVSAMLRAM